MNWYKDKTTHHSCSGSLALVTSTKKNITDLNILQFAFKAHNGLTPQYIIDMLMQYPAPGSLRPSSQQLLTVPLSRLKAKGDWGFPVVAPRLWNSLPSHISHKSCTTKDPPFFSCS